MARIAVEPDPSSSAPFGVDLIQIPGRVEVRSGADRHAHVLASLPEIDGVFQFHLLGSAPQSLHVPIGLSEKFLERNGGVVGAFHETHAFGARAIEEVGGSAATVGCAQWLNCGGRPAT
jgi:hypothetical protein